MLLLSPQNFKDYELIDCGNFEKLERFGQAIIRRPEPQAVWPKKFSEEEWKKRTNASFNQTGSHKGEWQRAATFRDPWSIEYVLGPKKLKFKLALTNFKHVGLFPEQASNWQYIFEKASGLKSENPKVLNLFAYTGAASLAAKAAGADVTHVDSVKQVVGWANDNMQLSGLDDIRWVVEDALKFVQREGRRMKKYQGILLDPPAYGIGAKGERWKLEEMIDELLKGCAEILDEEDNFFILNSYSLGFSSLIIENLVQAHFPYASNYEFGELFLPATSGVKLPLGVFGRFSSVK